MKNEKELAGAEASALPQQDLLDRLRARLSSPYRCGCDGEYHESCRDRALLQAAFDALAEASARPPQAQKDEEEERDTRMDKQADTIDTATAPANGPVTRTFEVTVMETRTGVITATMTIEAVSEDAANGLRDHVYETIDRVRNLLTPLQHITASEKVEP